MTAAGGAYMAHSRGDGAQGKFYWLPHVVQPPRSPHASL